MGFSAIAHQREAFLSAIQSSLYKPSDWKVLVADRHTHQQLLSSTDKKAIFDCHINNIYILEDSRERDLESHALYIVRPRLDIAEYIAVDFQRQMYKTAGIIWTSDPPQNVLHRVMQEPASRGRYRDCQTHHLDYYAQESHLVTLRNPWSFPFLFHPECGTRLPNHTSELAVKIAQYCISLGEDPIIRYHRPVQGETYPASTRCFDLAKKVKNILADHTRRYPNSLNSGSVNRSTLFIVDRTVDLVSPLLHEFTYQAMAYDLLQIKETDEIVYTPESVTDKKKGATKHIIHQKDEFWLANRHSDMKDVVLTVEAGFNEFKRTHPNASIKDDAQIDARELMSLYVNQGDYAEKVQMYALHLEMVPECMSVASAGEIKILTLLEQTMVTGWDEDQRQVKDVTDQIIEVLFMKNVAIPDKMRLLCLFFLSKHGLMDSDIKLLLEHAHIPKRDIAILWGFQLLGGPRPRKLKEKVVEPLKLFPTPKPVPTDTRFLSRYDNNINNILKGHIADTLQETTFPFYSDVDRDDYQQVFTVMESQKSLRASQPTWAQTRAAAQQEGQKPRIFMFMAGGATYGESRECYRSGKANGRDIILFTTHMLTPGLFLSQVGDLNVQRLQLPPLVPGPPTIAPIKMNTPPPIKTNNTPIPPQQQKTGTIMGLPSRPDQRGGPSSAPLQGAGLPMSLTVGAAPPNSASNIAKPKKRWLGSRKS